MFKWLMVIAVVYVVYTLFIKKQPIKDKSVKKAKKLDSNDMVECSQCGVFVSVDEAIISNGKYYCSKECLKIKS